MILAMPLIGSFSFPTVIKLLLAIGLAFLILPLVHIPFVKLQFNDWLIFTILKELALGLMIGFLGRFFFTVLSMAFEFMGLQIGFAIAGIFDPQNNVQVSALSQFGLILSVLIYFTLNFHHDLFLVITKSYEILPIGFEFKNVLANFVAHTLFFLKTSFLLAFQIALPILMAMLIIQIMIGVISRTAPQMNLFFNVSFFINLVLGLFAVYFVLPVAFEFLKNIGSLLMERGYGLVQV